MIIIGRYNWKAGSKKKSSPRKHFFKPTAATTKNHAMCKLKIKKHCLLFVAQNLFFSLGPSGLLLPCLLALEGGNFLRTVGSSLAAAGKNCRGKINSSQIEIQHYFIFSVAASSWRTLPILRKAPRADRPRRSTGRWRRSPPVFGLLPPPRPRMRRRGRRRRSTAPRPACSWAGTEVGGNIGEIVFGKNNNVVEKSGISSKRNRHFIPLRRKWKRMKRTL